MIYHKNYRARLIEEGDLDFITNLRTSQFVQENVGNFIFTNSISQKNWLNNISKSSSESFLLFEAADVDGYKKIGIIRLSCIDRVHRSMCVGGDIDLKYSGQGHGKIMYEIIFKIGFNIWGMHRLWLLVLEKNCRAINLYKKMGFVDEGRQREARYKDGNYVDYLMMSILEDEYKKLSNK
jgi:RimJ/RimL family protein N-acetyltransferase